MKLADELDQFPYPFKGDVYRYSNNSVPLEAGGSVQVTSHYEKEMSLKRSLLDDHAERCYQSLPHTLRAQWEALELIMNHLAADYPQWFELDKNGRQWTFHNKKLGETSCLTFGDEATLSYEPLDFIGRHVQEDLILMVQRDGDLFLDAGQLCFPSNWSLAFNVGMDFKNIHQPIPGFKEEGLDERILRFLLRMEAGNPWWRRNWSLMAGSRLDTSLETFSEWGKERMRVTKENAGRHVHLRVEVQKLFRLPETNSILFTIHTHLLPLEKFVQKKEWLEQFYHVLQELPSFIAEYKGLSLYRGAVMDYLKEQLVERG
jgi:hypothetical protein